MTPTIRTPTAEWRQADDGTWEVVRLGSGSTGGGTITPEGGSAFLTPDEIRAGDNVEVIELPGDQLLIRRGGHMVLYSGVPLAWRRNLDFQGEGVQVVDDAAGERTIVTIGSHVPGMAYMGPWDPATLYTFGEVVSYGDALFIFTGGAQGLGFGLGPFGEGPFGGSIEGAGFGSDPFGGGLFGG